MKPLHSILLILLLTTASSAGNLARSFTEATALADAQDKDRATRIYAQIDLHDYYQKKYGDVLGSCFKSTNHADASPFSFVAAIGANGRVLRLYVDHQTNIYNCVRQTLEKDEFPHPPIAPYYLHVSMTFNYQQ